MLRIRKLFSMDRPDMFGTKKAILIDNALVIRKPFRLVRLNMLGIRKLF
jgi:hypothetical protein